MTHGVHPLRPICTVGATVAILAWSAACTDRRAAEAPSTASHTANQTAGVSDVEVRHAVARDRSAPLRVLAPDGRTDDSDAAGWPETSSATRHRLSPEGTGEAREPERDARPIMDVPRGAEEVEQRAPGARAAATLVASFDGLGVGFTGPQGTATGRNPSDNSLAVGPDHVMQVVNSRMAIFSKKGRTFAASGQVLYGPVETRNVFRDFGGPCENRNNGDAVARYDQLANRWLIVMPIFSRVPVRQNEPSVGRSGEPARRSQPGQLRQPGDASPLFQPGRSAETPPAPPVAPAPGTPAVGTPAPGAPSARPQEQGTYAMCYAVSTTPDPFGPYYRYEFIRPLFPDYPRPAVWPDGYYVPTSTGDEVIQKHACVVDRLKMLKGLDATEQCVIVDGVNFLNNADLDGTQLPPVGAPNIMLAAGGTQLKNDLTDDGIYAWTFRVNWNDPLKTKVEGPVKIAVAPYHYLCGGQLTSCVPQPGTDRRLDAQGDKLMARVVYRRIGAQQSIVAVHSVNTAAGAGGVRWYEFRLGAGANGALRLHQQGTFAPDGFYRWMASPAMDGKGNIGIGYSFGGTPNFAGQRFAGRLAGDSAGTLTMRETVLVEGEGSQTNTLRWEDYSQTAVDPSDDCTIWYVGDYFKKGASNYSTKIGAFRMPGCVGAP